MPAVSTTFILFGVMHGMMEMVKAKYSAKDDNGKWLFPHPYQPWKNVDPKYQDKADKAFRTFKMFENVKEWTFLALPLFWMFSIFGGGLPFMNDQIMDGITLLSGIGYMIGNHMYITGYTKTPADRLKGFKIRRKVVEFWLFGSVVSTVWGSFAKYYYA